MLWVVIRDCFAKGRLQCHAGGVASRDNADLHFRHKCDEPKEQCSQDQHSIERMQWRRTEYLCEVRDIGQLCKAQSAFSKTSRAHPSVFGARVCLRRRPEGHAIRAHLNAFRARVCLCGRPESHAIRAQSAFSRPAQHNREALRARVSLCGRSWVVSEWQQGVSLEGGWPCSDGLWLHMLSSREKTQKAYSIF